MNEETQNYIKIITRQLKELSFIYNKACSKIGISSSEFWVWYALIVLDGEISQQDISDEFFLPKQTINTVVSNLSKNGYVSLEAIPGTRNKKIIKLSKKGEEYGKNIIKDVYESEKKTLESMSKEDCCTFISLLEKYTEKLNENI